MIMNFSAKFSFCVAILVISHFFNPGEICAQGCCQDFPPGSPYYSHIFIDKIYRDSDVIVPCQSVYDVRVAARLGFRYIEANVHKTATPGKYIVMHGYKGRLGYQVTDLQGNDVPDVVIAETPFRELMDNYVYRSRYPKYRTRISSLEDFLYECRSSGIAPLIQYVDEEERRIVHSIMGDDVIFYNGVRDGGFKGMIMEYRLNRCLEDILYRCRLVGPPYMYCMGNVKDFSDDELREIVAGVHSEGCLIGFAGCYESPETNARLLGMGFDFSASGWETNDFSHGNMCDVSGDMDYSSFRGGKTVAGIHYLAEGESFMPKQKLRSVFLSASSLHIRFCGRIRVCMGDYIDAEYESDGSQSLWLSTYHIDSAPGFKITAATPVEIFEVTYRASER